MKSTLLRLKILSGMITLIFILLLWRFGQIQLLETKKFKTLSENNRIRMVSLKAPRGEIKDIKGRVLVKNKTIFIVSVNDLGTPEKTLAAAQRINTLLKLPKTEMAKIRKEINNPWRRRFEPLKMMDNVPKEIVAKLEERKLDLDGVLVDVEPIRQYKLIAGSPIAPHILGFTNKINDLQWKNNRDYFIKAGYFPNDRIGQTGLEKYYEELLRGTDGARQIEVDASFRPVRELATLEPKAGNTLTITLDANLQKVAENSLNQAMLKVKKKYPKAKAGALVVLDVRTGAVLAMASRPGFNPNMFSRKITQKEVDVMYRVKDFPAAINRAMYSYAPGSTFKMVTAIAGLESGLVWPKGTIYDRGSIRLGDKSFYCWNKSGHGTVDLEEALTVSCNTYFYLQGQKIGINNIEKYARELGLGIKTGIDLPDEKQGVRPSPKNKLELKGPLFDALFKDKIKEIEKKYRFRVNKAPLYQKEKLFKEKQQLINKTKKNYKIIKKYETSWHAYDTVNTSIGQGYNSYSPLQLANYAAAIATKGIRFQPYLVEKIQDIKGKVIYRHKKKQLPKAQISAKTFDIIKNGMYEVTHSYRGTAAGTFRNFPVAVGAKTGTAQNPPKENNAIFVGFAPFDQPKVAFAVLIEQGGHGGESAAPAAREVLAEYFNIKRAKPINKLISKKIKSSKDKKINNQINNENTTEQKVEKKDSQKDSQIDNNSDDKNKNQGIKSKEENKLNILFDREPNKNIFGDRNKP